MAISLQVSALWCCGVVVLCLGSWVLGLGCLSGARTAADANVGESKRMPPQIAAEQRRVHTSVSLA
eukprot:1826915-Rhodomonas_salina.3